jgi:hypothetical protein
MCFSKRLDEKMQLPPFLIFLFARPFRPFFIHLSDGRSAVVTHPESVSVYTGGLGLWLVLPSGQVQFIEGDAVVSVTSAEEADPSEFILET